MGRSEIESPSASPVVCRVLPRSGARGGPWTAEGGRSRQGWRGCWAGRARRRTWGPEEVRRGEGPPLLRNHRAQDSSRASGPWSPTSGYRCGTRVCGTWRDDSAPRFPLPEVGPLGGSGWLTLSLVKVEGSHEQCITFWVCRESSAPHHGVLFFLRRNPHTGLSSKAGP